MMITFKKTMQEGIEWLANEHARLEFSIMIHEKVVKHLREQHTLNGGQLEHEQKVLSDLVSKRNVIMMRMIKLTIK